MKCMVRVIIPVMKGITVKIKPYRGVCYYIFLGNCYMKS